MLKKDNLLQELLDNIIASIEGGIFTVDKNSRITSFNRSAEEITGFKQEEVLGQKCRNIFKSILCKENCPLKKTLETGKPVFNYEIMIYNKTGNMVPVNITTSPLRSRNNELIGAVENFRD